MILKKEINRYVNSCLLDFNNEIRPAGIFDLFQDIAKNHVTDLGYSFYNMYELGYYWVLLSQEYKVVSRLPLFNEEIKIVTYPKKREKLEFEREFEIRDKDDNLLIIANSNWVVIDIKNRMLSKAKDIEFDGEYYQNIHFTDKPIRRLNLNPNNVIEEFNYKVLLSDIDSNHHMNNAKYLDVIYNMHIGFELNKIKKILISFDHEVKLNETINVVYFKNESNDSCYIGYVNDIKCFQVIIKE